MESSSSRSSRNRSGDQMIRMNLESNVQEGQERQPKLLMRVWMVSATRLKGHWMSDLFKLMACLMTAL